MMSNIKILFIVPKNLKEGQPSKERIESFKLFYEKNDCRVYVKEMPITIKEKLSLINFIYLKNIKNVFISMPPFRNWFIFFIPFINIIFDIRDGWSIAIKSGYGGISKPNKIKSYLAYLVEKFAINRARLTITCTNGLDNYFKKVSSKKILLVTNGYSKEDFQKVLKLKERVSKEEKIFDIAICVGKFSEYGKNKVKIILKKINKNDKKTFINLIGSSVEENKWIANWIQEEQLKNIELNIFSRMSKSKMYEEILKADYGIAVIRDPNYEFGTKVFDYILCQKPIFDYFDEKNNFVNFFNEQMYSSCKQNFNVNFLRENLILKEKKILLGSLK